MASSAATDSITGTVEVVTFYNPQNGYYILKVLSDHSLHRVTVVGSLPPVFCRGRYQFSGVWVSHEKWGKQFKADHCELLLPRNPDGIVKLLQSNIFKGIGPKTAKKIVQALGEKIFEILEHNPSAVFAIPGLQKPKAQSLINAWREQKSIKEIIGFLKKFDITVSFAQNLIGHYGENALAILQENPYRLAEDLWGVGFKKADQIALQLDGKPDSVNRIKSGLVFCLNRAQEGGHTFLPRSELVKKAAELLEIAVDKVVITLDEILQQKNLIQEYDGVYLPFLHHHEKQAAYYLSRLNRKNDKRIVNPEAIKAALQKFQIREQRTLEPEQIRAVSAMLQEPLLVLTGGPGTGKTTSLKAAVALAEDLGLITLLAAPTGRASRRMAELTGRPASTLHRLLEYIPGTQIFKKGPKNCLEADLVIIDEVSMVDISLFYFLVRACHPSTRIVFIGDADQLPSVGPGRVLHDLLESPCFCCLRLQKVFRQAEKSLIVRNAHLINTGTFPLFSHPEANTDFFFITEEAPLQVQSKIVDLVCRQLPQRYCLNPQKDIQILCPMNRGEIGTRELNVILQKKLNSRAGGNASELAFYPGDKVMQLRNNYDKEVYNGDIGVVEHLDRVNRGCIVRFGNPVHYRLEELEELSLAYAITVHKSQGSEYPGVIMPILTQHYLMLQRKILYTALTRAKQVMVLVGSRTALSLAVQNIKEVVRYSNFRKWLV
jgi:exodeoxyribonuclease V alpha subunit